MNGYQRHSRSRLLSAIRHTSVIRMLAFIVLGGYCLTAVGSMVWTASTSLKTDPQFFSSLPWTLPDPATLTNFTRAWDYGHIGDYFRNSVIVASTSTVLCLTIGSMAAYALSRIPTRLNGKILGYLLLGIMIPGVVLVIPIYNLYQGLGLLDTLQGLILVYVARLLPFTVFILTGFFRTLPTELEEAAAIDGSSPLNTFVRIMVPLARPGLAAAGVLLFLEAWNEFFFALVLNNGRGAATLPVGLLNLDVNATYAASWPPVFAGLIITAIPVLALYALFQGHITKGLSAGALKG